MKNGKRTFWRSIPMTRRKRIGIVGGALMLIGALGWGFAVMPQIYHTPREAGAANAVASAPAVVSLEQGTSTAPAAPGIPAGGERAAELKRRFDESVAMLHARKYEYALASLHRVLELSPKMPEAHVNMGFALIGLKDFGAARDFFKGAVELNPRQANAYYGLAVAHEGLGELPEALGAMRSYLHLSPAQDRFHEKARAAIWEWESALGQSGGGREGAAKRD